MPMPPNCNEQHANTGSQCSQQHHHKHVAVPHPQAPNMTRASAKPTRLTRSNNRNPQKANMKRPCTEKIAPIQVRVYTTAGNLVADLHLDEPIVVRKLKNKLVPVLGVSKYRQTLLQDTRVLNDNDKIRKTARLHFVLLNYIPTSTDNIRQLIDASFENSESEVEELLSKPQGVNACLPSTAYPNTANGTTTALQAAASANNTHILKVLFQAHADVNRNGNDRALSHAANQNVEEAARILLQHRANPNTAGRNGHTALLYAVAGGHHALATLILAARANPNQGNDTTRTPFGVACHNNDEEMATTLLLARSHVHTPRHPPPHYQYNTTALCAAASANCVSGLKHLLETSIHIDSQVDAPALWYATWNGRTEAIDFLPLPGFPREGPGEGGPLRAPPGGGADRLPAVCTQMAPEVTPGGQGDPQAPAPHLGEVARARRASQGCPSRRGVERLRHGHRPLGHAGPPSTPSWARATK